MPDTHALFADAVRHHQAARLSDAEMLYRRILAINPRHAESLHLLGMVGAQTGRHDLAVDMISGAIEVNPNEASYHCNLGSLLSRQRRLDEAVACFRRAIDLAPGYAGTHYNLGNALREKAELDEAAACYRKALELKPDYPEAHNNLAVVLQAQGRCGDAAAQYERAISLRPDYAEAHNNLGVTLRGLGRLAEAMVCYERALAIKPGYPQARLNLGNLLLNQERFDEAIAQYERLLAVQPDWPEVHCNLGTARLKRGDPEAGIVHYQQALALKPDYAPAHHYLGSALQGLGRLTEAQHAYETAIEIAPATGRFYRHLFEVRSATAGDKYILAMEKLAQNITSLSNHDQTELHFALGKAYADLEEYERSFHHLLMGNQRKRRDVAYDEPAMLRFLDRIRAVFAPELMQSKQGLGDPSAVPVFIVGMPRSGSTLVEQILASHRQVLGAGERPHMMHVVGNLRSPVDAAASFPEVLPLMSGDMLRQHGRSYVSASSAAAPAALRITDKMPGNFAYAGLIHLILPNARIIHTRRDPVDTCLSCFSILFASGNPQTYDLAELGRYYRAYSALMEHWRDVLPPGVMLEVQYEDLVADTERQARRIVRHCGLEWDDACLDFRAAQRPVWTASAAQVRRPIYHSSVGRWRRYSAFLTPLLQALEAAGEGSPSMPDRAERAASRDQPPGARIDRQAWQPQRAMGSAPPVHTLRTPGCEGSTST
jgi:tetratricopeptide (TPR) repeat protein